MLSQLGDYEIELIAGSGGVFDIYVDNELRYSKKQTGRFPDDGEVTAVVKT